MAVFFMTLLFGIALAFIRLIPGEFYAAQRLETDTIGYYVSDSGVSMALAWLESIGPQGVASNINNDWQAFDATFPALPSSSPNPSLGGIRNFTTNASPGALPTSFIQTGTFTVLTTSSLPPSNVASKLPAGWVFDAQVQRWNYRDSTGTGSTYFVVVSEAKRASHSGSGMTVYRRVRCWARPASFSDDAYAVDTLPSDIWLALDTFHLTGPYRTNGRVMLYPPSNFWPSSTPSASPRAPAINGTISMWKGDTSLPALSGYDSTDRNRRIHPGTNSIVDGVTYPDHTDQTRMPYNITTGAAMNDRYAEITTNGRSGIVTTDNRQDMPTNTENLANIALGATAPPPNQTLGPTNSTSVFGSSSTVNLHATTSSGGIFGKTLQGGLYFEGDVETVKLSAPSAADGNGNSSDGNTNSQMFVQQGTGSSAKNVTITQVYESYTLPAGAIVNGLSPLGTAQTLNANSNGVGYTVIKDGSNPLLFRVYEGTGNGSYYFTGNVNGLEGVNRGRKTLATRTDTGSNTTYDKQITITGNLTRADTTAGQNVTGVRDQLGIIGYRAALADNSKLHNNSGGSATRASTTNANPLYIYAAFVLGRDNDPNSTSMTTGGGLGSISYDDSSQGVGMLKLFGSLTEGVRQVKGLIGSSGNAYQYNYDPNMSTLPPPFFPQKSRFKIDAWNEESVFNY